MVEFTAAAPPAATAAAAAAAAAAPAGAATQEVPAVHAARPSLARLSQCRLSGTFQALSAKAAAACCDLMMLWQQLHVTSRGFQQIKPAPALNFAAEG
jgi:hypothetical protein